MKTLKTTFAILCIALLSISCSKSDNNSSQPGPAGSGTNDNFIRCKVDGAAYEITGSQIFNYKDASGFNISYDNTLGPIGIDMAVAGEPIVKTYTFTSSNIVTVGRLQFRSPDIYSTAFCPTSTGTLIITAKNGNTIEGTFSFSGKKALGCANAAKVVTDGTFKITYR